MLNKQCLLPRLLNPETDLDESGIYNCDNY